MRKHGLESDTYAAIVVVVLCLRLCDGGMRGGWCLDVWGVVSGDGYQLYLTRSKFKLL